ncbi:spheroidene monooxygenase [Sulfitobacter sp. D35]|uniref:spheroidene monooxygenase n=1 Tax=Sulfitobacter sp. D35 TaxID=3083252 RepID=UPI00296FD039|nr:spheroidene monooxygenase [Sulfitobacter sp. D35]MDW4499428.1 spheroidene monooxygenase [Sulfitobacter sp. D35]
MGGAIQTVSLSFYRFAPGRDRVWAFAMMGAGRPAMRRVKGLTFWKFCGSGTGEGFTPVPNTGVYAILAVWDSDAAAHAQTRVAPVFARFARRARECWTVFLRPVSSRGSWSGTRPFTESEAGIDGPIAALTRASVKPSAALQFWKRVPDISAMIGANARVLFKIGIGEVPLFHQVTFSIWPDVASMADFARTDGPHARAIRAVRDGNWFREELYARFAVLGERGIWNGVAPVLPAQVAA